MLLPSALSCDGSQQSPFSRLSYPNAFVSPPASPPMLPSAAAITNMMTSCRSLQSLMANNPVDQSEAAPAMAQLPTPPLAHAAPPMKLRLRARPNKAAEQQKQSIDSEAGTAPRRRIVKRAPQPSRGVNKRRRDEDDDMGRECSESEADMSGDEVGYDAQSLPTIPHTPSAPSTPKRARIAPEQLPLGLGRSDFHDIHLDQQPQHHHNPLHETDVETEADGAEWSAEDDRILVELVLEKLKLTKAEWQDCARSLGKDRHSVGRRWKSLIMGGDVGIKTRSGRRTRLHSTWR